MRHTFSASGAQQFQGDIQAIESIVDASIRLPGEAAKGLRRLGQGVGLLVLPIKPSSGSGAGLKKRKAAGEEDEGDGWGFDDDDEADAGDAAGSDGEERGGVEMDADLDWGGRDDEERSESRKSLSLWEVEKRVFRSNESARNVLMVMGFETLSEADARAVLERRVEVGS